MERQDMSTLWYTKPAAEWEEALPLGNGRLGAMIAVPPRTRSGPRGLPCAGCAGRENYRKAGACDGTGVWRAAGGA